MNRTILFPGFKYKALTLSYDDGVEQDKRLIDIMVRHGLKGTFNVNTGLFAPYPGRMTDKEAFDLYRQAGMEVAAHGRTHARLTHLSPAERIREILDDRDRIEQATGTFCRGFAYADGSCSEDAARIVEDCGFLYARTTKNSHTFSIPENWLLLSPTVRHADADFMDLARRFAEPLTYRRARLFYLWGHSFEFDMQNNWRLFEDFAQTVGGKDDIWYATNGEIFIYLRDWNRIESSADGRTLYNPTASTLYLCVNGYDGAKKRDITLAPGEYFTE